MSAKIKNVSTLPQKIYILIREEIVLEPGDELEFDGDLEIVD
jgi:hypothetical protein